MEKKQFPMPSDNFIKEMEGATSRLEKEYVDAYKKLADGLQGKKLYKLSDMWKVWFFEDGIIHSYPNFYFSKEQAQTDYWVKSRKDLIAITRADATEFYEGEGLE